MASLDAITDPSVVMCEFFQRKINKFFPVDARLKQAIDEICADVAEFEPGHHFARSEEDYGNAYLVDNGWIFRSRTLENGARQIVNVAIPGDLICLNALLFGKSDFDLVAKTSVTAYRLPPERLRALFNSYPSFAMAMFWCHAQEESVLAERVVSLGRRSARERTAHVLCEFMARAEILDFTDPSQMLLPISQADLSDILGISIVHTNRTLRGLQRDGVISFRDELLTVLDRPALERAAGFDAGYLHFTHRSDKRFLSPTLVDSAGNLAG